MPLVSLIAAALEEGELPLTLSVTVGKRNQRSYKAAEYDAVEYDAVTGEIRFAGNDGTMPDKDSGFLMIELGKYQTERREIDGSPEAVQMPRKAGGYCERSKQ